MTTGSPQTEFDCVALKQRVQAAIHEAVRGLSPAEELAYFRRSVEAGSLGPWWKGLTRVGETPPPRAGTPPAPKAP